MRFPSLANPSRRRQKPQTRKLTESPLKRNGLAFEPLEQRNLLAVDFDLTFNASGWRRDALGSGDDAGQAIALQSDGKIVVAGVAHNGSNNDLAVVRYNDDGSLDTSFDGDGIRKLYLGPSYVAVGSIAVQPDGKIVVAGTSMPSGVLRATVVRFNADGSLDDGSGADSTPGDSFASSGIFRSTLGYTWDESFGLAIQSDGKIVVGGYVRNSGLYDTALWRLNSDGTPDTSFGTGGASVVSLLAGSDSATRLLLQGSKIVVGGYGDNGTSGHVPVDFLISRFNSNGTLDATFGNGGKTTTHVHGEDVTRDMEFQGSNIVVVGSSWDGGIDARWTLVRYTADGLLDTSFGAGGKTTVSIPIGSEVAYSLAALPNGNLLVAGGLKSGATQDLALMLFTHNGLLDSTFDGDGQLIRSLGMGDDIARASLLDGAGRIVVAGNSHNGSNHDLIITRFAVTNAAPVAHPGGPYALAQNGTLYLDAALSYDNDPGDHLTFSWDLDFDGQYDDATGVNPAVAWASLAGLGAGTHAIGLRVTDNGGASTTATTTLALYDRLSLIKDINARPLSSLAQDLTVVGGTLFFTAIDASRGRELWKSNLDGSAVSLVKDISLPGFDSQISNLTNVEGTLYFTAGDAVNGLELWKSDGTSSGTVMVRDIMPGPISSSIRYLANVAGVLYFTASYEDC